MIAEYLKEHKYQKPRLKLDDNRSVYHLLNIACKELRGITGASCELTKRAYNAKSYEEALEIVKEYIEVEE